MQSDRPPAEGGVGVEVAEHLCRIGIDEHVAGLLARRGEGEAGALVGRARLGHRDDRVVRMCGGGIEPLHLIGQHRLSGAGLDAHEVTVQDRFDLEPEQVEQSRDGEDEEDRDDDDGGIEVPAPERSKHSGMPSAKPMTKGGCARVRRSTRRCRRGARRFGVRSGSAGSRRSATARRGGAPEVEHGWRRRGAAVAGSWEPAQEGGEVEGNRDGCQLRHEGREARDGTCAPVVKGPDPRPTRLGPGEQSGDEDSCAEVCDHHGRRRHERVAGLDHVGGRRRVLQVPHLWVGGVSVAESLSELRCGTHRRTVARRGQAQDRVGDELLHEKQGTVTGEMESVAAQRHTRDCQERAHGKTGGDSGSGASRREVSRDGECHGEPAERQARATQVARSGSAEVTQ